MPKPRLFVALSFALMMSACDNKSGDSASTRTSTASPISQATATASPSATASLTASTSVPADPSVTVGHIRVTLRKVSVGKVPLKAADGTTTYSDEPRLMIALRIENLSDKKKSKYETWVPDLEMAKTVAKLTDDRGAELKRVSLGFGNNIKGRTVSDDLTPGNVIADLLLFEIPPPGAHSFRLELPGANCGVKEPFIFQFDTANINR